MAILDSVTTTRAPKEDEAFNITGISITGTASQTVTFTSVTGTFVKIGAAGSGTGTISFTGTPSAINIAMSGMTFQGVANANGAASFVVSTNESGVSSQTVNLSISPVNDAPTMASGTPLVINEAGMASFTAPIAGTTGFTQSQLGLADGDNSTTQVIIKLASLPANGTLKLADTEIAVGSTFSVSQLNTLSYTHNGAEVTAPAGVTDTFNITVDDGAGGLITNQAVSVKIMPVNDAPTVSGTINIIEGETNIRLDDNSMLMAPFLSARGAITGTDVDDTTLIYKITSLPAIGTLKYNGTDVALTSGSFTVTDLSKLTYSHDGSETTTSVTFGISVTDNGGGAGTGAKITAPATIKLNILPNNDDPILPTNVEQTLGNGVYTLAITTAMLQVTDVDSSAKVLTYTVTGVPATDNGYFKLGNYRLIEGNTFTQDDIDNNRLSYVARSGIAHTDELLFTVKDGGRGVVLANNTQRDGGIYTDATGTTLQTNTFKVNAPARTGGVDTLPDPAPNNSVTLGGDNAATLNESASYTLTASDLLATSTQVASADLVYRLITLPNSGSIKLDGAALTFNQSFTQADITAGKVIFDHAGEEDFNDTFTYSVSDGNWVSPPQTFNITTTPQNDTPTAAVGARVVLAEGGQNVVINNNQIKLVDADNSTSDNEIGYAVNQDLSFKITALPTHGFLTLGTATHLAINDVVTSAQLSAGTLKYSHDSSENYTDSFKLVPLDSAGVTVSTATNQSSTGMELTVPITISPLNDTPVFNNDSELVANEAGAIKEGQAIVIGGATGYATINGVVGSGTPTTIGVNTGTAHISYSDTDNTSEQRQYRITTAPAHGDLLRNGVVMGVGSVVTQEDLDTGKVSYRHNGSENFTDKIEYVVSDGDYTVNQTTSSPQGATPVAAVYNIEILPTNDAPKMSGQTTIINLDNTSAPNPITGFSLADSDLATITPTLEIDFVQVTVRLLGATGTPFADVNAYSGVTLAVTASGATVDATNGYLIVRGTSTAVNTALGTLNVTVPTDLDTAYKVQVIVDDRLRNGSGVLISGANGGTTNQNQTAGGTPTVIDTTELNWYTTQETIPTTHTANVSASSVTVRASSVNDPAVLATATAGIAIDEDVATPINGFTVSDAESLAFALPVTVTLSASNGTVGIAGSGAQTTTTVNGHSITIAGDNTGSLVLTGQAADIQDLLNNATNGLTYTSPVNGNHDYNGADAGDVTLTVSLDDEGSRIGGNVGAGSVATNPANVIIPITLNAINDKPGVTASITPVTISAAGGATAILGFGITDVDYTDITSTTGITDGEVDFIQVIVRITDNVGSPVAAGGYTGITLASSPSAAANVTVDSIYNGVDSALMIRGAGVYVNAYLTSLTLSYPAGANPDAIYKVQVIADDRLRDNAGVLATGAGAGKANGGLNADGNVPTVAIDPYTHTETQITAAGFAVNNVAVGVNTVFVSTVNDPAVITATDVTVAENSAIVVFDATKGNFIVNDSDDNGANNLSATVTVSKGTITAVGGTGGTVGILGGASVTITGATEVDLNSRLKAITVTLINDNSKGSVNWNGSFDATVVVNDGGNTGVRPNNTDFATDANVATSGNGDFAFADGTSANLTTTRTITVNVTPVNDAPMRVDATPVSLDPILEDNTAPAGDTVANLFSSKFTDAVDTITNGSTANTFAGIAITTNAATVAQGTWQYSTDGATWTALPAVSTTSTLQLHTTDLLRFVPAANYNGTPGALTARLIDSSVTAFTSGSVVNVTTSGGTTAYSDSSNAVTLGTSVTAVNDPAAVNATNVTVTENSATLIFDATNGNFIVNDPDDNNANTLSATVTISTGTITAVGAGGAVSGLNTGTITITGATEAQLNSQLKAITVTFINDNSKGSVNWNGSFDTTVVVNDGGNTGVRPVTIAGDTGIATANPGDYDYAATDSTSNLITTRTITVNVTAANDAPTRVDAIAATLPAILEDNTAPTGDTVANLFGSKFTDTLDTITNGSTANTFAGIAITTNPATGAEGAWQYSTNGTTWTALPAVSITSALQLHASDLLRFVPAANYNGTPGALTARLIDSSVTAFTSGSTVNVTTSGGTTAYSDSSNAVTLNTSVTPVNDAPAGTDKTIPILVNSPGYAITAADFGFSDPLDSPANLLSNVIVTSLPDASAGVYKLGSTPLTVNQVLTRAEIDGGTLKFIPATNAIGTGGAMGFTVQDNGGTSTGVDTDQSFNTLQFTTSAPVASIAVSPATVAETGVNKLVYTVTLSVAPAVDTVINLTTTGDATAGSDYAGSKPVSVTILAGQTTGKIEIDPTDDGLVEANETIVLTLNTGNGYTVTTTPALQTAIGTITDNTVPVVNITVAPATVTEDGVDKLVYIITLDQPPVVATTVSFTTNGTATTGTDYTADGVTNVMFAIGEISKEVNITPVTDTTVESNETVVLTLTGGSGYALGANTVATGTITNDDVPVATIAVTSDVFEDGSDVLTYTVTLDKAPLVDTVVNFTTTGSIAVNDDYTSNVSVSAVTVKAGELTGVITVSPTDDNSVEPNETVIVTLVSGTGYEVGAAKEATGTIKNDDLPIATIAVNPGTVVENGTANLVYTITLSQVPLVPTTVNLTTSGTAVSADYTGDVISVTFAANETVKTVTIDPIADGLVEPNESVIVTIATGTGYTPSTTQNSATGTITDLDLPVAGITVSPATVAEDGTPNLVYTVTLSQTPLVDTVVKFATTGTATFDADYSADVTTQEVIIKAGETSATVTVDPTADTTGEPDETVVLSLTSGVGYTIDTAKQVAIGTISNDDAPIATIAVSPTTIVENGTPNLVYTVTLSYPPAVATTVNLTTSGTAITADYTGNVTSVIIPANQTTATVTIDPIADGLVEPNESVIVTLGAGTGYTIGAENSATGTITDLDLPIASIAVSPASAVEDGTPNLVYTVTLSQIPLVDTVVKFATSGTATFGNDYSTDVTFQEVTILAGTKTATVTVDPTADTTSEPNETVVLSLIDGRGYTIDTAKQVATGTMTNDDAPVATIAVSPAIVAENGTPNLVYTVTLSQVQLVDTVVKFAATGSATVGADYAADVTAQEVTIKAGQTSATVTVDPTLDGIAETDETVILTLINGAGYTVTTDLAKQAATGTITDANLPVASISVTDKPVTENGSSSLIYTVTLDKAPTADMVINLTTAGTAVDADYTGAVASVTIKAGQLSGTIAIDPAPDSITEPDETVIFTVAPGAGYTISPTQHTAMGTITDVNIAPVAIDDTVNGYLNKPVTVNLVGTDADGTVSSVTVKKLPPVAEGKLYLADGTTPVAVDMILTSAVAANLKFVPTPTFTGISSFTFTVTDNSGAVDETPATMSVNISQATIDLPAKFDTGASDTDNAINITTVDLQGNALASSIVKVTAPNGETIGTVVANPQGVWTLPSVNLTTIVNDAGLLGKDGLFTFDAKSFNAAGVQLADAAPLTITLDTIAPDKPASIMLSIESDRMDRSATGDGGAIDGITADSTPKFNVALPVGKDLQPGYIVKLYATPIDGTTPQLVAEHILTAAEVAQGNVDLTTITMQDGKYTFVTQIFDMAGNVKDDARTVAEIITDLDGVMPVVELSDASGGDFNHDGVKDWQQNGVTTFPVLPTTGVSGSAAFNAGVGAPKASFGALVAVNLKDPAEAIGDHSLKPDANTQFEDVSVLPFTATIFNNKPALAGFNAVTDPVKFTITNFKSVDANGVDNSTPMADASPTRDGLQTRVVLEIPNGVFASTFIKFGPTPDNVTPHFFEFLAKGTMADYNDGALLFDKDGKQIGSEGGMVTRIVLTLTDGGLGDLDGLKNGMIVDPGYLAVKTPTPAPTPTYTPDPVPTGAGGGADADTCANDVMLDGVTAEKVSFNVLVVPVVTAASLDSAASTNPLLADIPVATNGNEVLLQVSIPEHVGFTAEAAIVPCNDFTLRELLITHAEPRVEPITAFNTILQQGIDKYLPTVVDEKQVLVRTIVFNQDNTVVSGEPIIVKGVEADSAHPLRQEALVIDAHTLPAGTVIQLDNVEFAVVMGDVKVIGGAGSNFIMGDDGVQVFSAGVKNDVVMGNIGDDTLDAGLGHNLLDGGAGVNTLVLNPTGELRVYLTHNAANKANPYDQVVVDMASGEQTIYRNVEKVTLNGNTYSMDFLNLPGSQMETLGVLSQLLFDKAPGIELVSKWGTLSSNTPELVRQVLGSDTAQAALNGLDDAAFAKLMVQNGLGSSDAGSIQFVVDYLQTHSRAELIELAVKAPIVIDHAYSNGGLAIIANDHSKMALVTEAEVLNPANKASLTPLTGDTHIHHTGLIQDDTAVTDRHIERLIVPIVTPTRVEDSSTPNKTLADIPVIKNGNEVLLQVSLPVSVGFTSEAIISDDGKPLSLRDLLVASFEPRIEPLSAFNDLVQQGVDGFMATVKDPAQVVVRTLVFNQETQTAAGDPIIIQGALGKGEGDTAHPLRQEAVIIDAHTLAPGTTIQLDSVEFAIVIGDVNVIGGKGSNFIIADGHTQSIAGGEGNDTLMGYIGDDYLNGGQGVNLVDGGAGVDTLGLDFKATDPLHVYLTHSKADQAHPLDTMVVNEATGEHTTFRNIEKVDLNGSTYDIKFLAQSGAQLEKIGVLSTLLLGKAPGIGMIVDLETATDTSALINKFLASDAVKAQLNGLSNHDLATLIVTNGLGSADAGAISFSEDYLQTHGVADLLLVGVGYQPIVEHAYGTEGLMLF